MAYFANSSEGYILDEQCDECIHKDPEVMCPVSYVQHEFNYSQHNKGNEDLVKALNMLIDEDGQCKMKPFVESFSGKVNKHKKCFQRKLVFGDEEQIAALSGE